MKAVEDCVAVAINHPVGRATRAILDWSYRDADSQGIGAQTEEILTAICRPEVTPYRHGRVVLASHLPTLFKMDQAWATIHLVPYFDWNETPAEALGVWQGFLWSPRISEPLLAALKPFFLETAKHYEELGRYAEQYANFATFVALNPKTTLSTSELRELFAAMPDEGLVASAATLVRAMRATRDDGEYWENRIRPFLRLIWPKSAAKKSEGVSRNLAEMCLESGDSFPQVLQEVKHWLQPARFTGPLLRNDNLPNLCKIYPSESLHILNTVIGDQPVTAPDLKERLQDIRDADPELALDPHFQRLSNRVL